MSIDIEADVTIEGPDGLVGRVTGEGSRLRLHAERATEVVDELRRLGPRETSGFAAFAERLADEGVTAMVSGPRGDVVTVGAEANSALGRLVAGTRRVQPGTLAAVRPLAVGFVRDQTREHRRVLLGTALVVVALWLGRNGGRRT